MKENKITSETKNNPKDKEILSEIPEPERKRESKKDTGNKKQNKRTNEDTNSFKWLGIIWSIQDFIQVILAVLTLFTLAAFIVFSSIQSSKTKEALKRADTANFYTRQSIELTRQISETSDSLNRKAIEIADSSMKVSSKIAEMQEEFSKMELRAYMSLRDTIEIKFHPNERFEYKIKISNEGKTPAINVSHFSAIAIGDKISQSDYNNMATGKHKQLSNIGINEFRRINTVNDFIIPENMYNMIIQRKINLFIIGHVRYDDVFGDTHFI